MSSSKLAWRLAILAWSLAIAALFRPYVDPSAAAFRPIAAVDPRDFPLGFGTLDEAALAVLRRADVLRESHVGISGSTPPEVVAWRQLAASRHATALFENLLESSALAGRLYALAGLRAVDSLAFERAMIWVDGITYPGTVTTQRGCFVDPEPMSDIVAEIRSGRWSRELRGLPKERALPHAAPAPANPPVNTPDFAYCGDRAGDTCSLWDPTVVQLLARPELYHDKLIRTIGFLHLQFEGNGLYASESDAEHVFGSGIWVDVPDSFRVKKPLVNDRYVILEGRYHGGPGGHFGASKGRLDGVVRLDPWPSRSEIAKLWREGAKWPGAK